MKSLLILSMLLLAHINAASANTPAVNGLLQSYITSGVTSGNASKGEQLWNKTFAGQPPYSERRCASCHSNKLTNTGKHVRTGKSIAPMAPSVNSKSMNQVKNINKWLKRNCKWTLGRECSVQEKADLITFISQQ